MSTNETPRIFRCETCSVVLTAETGWGVVRDIYELPTIGPHREFEPGETHFYCGKHDRESVTTLVR